MSELESVRMPFLAQIGKCQNRKKSELASVRIGKCQSWKVSEYPKIRKCQNFRDGVI